MHPLRIAGILSNKQSNSSAQANANISNIKQHSQHEVHTFYKEVQKQHEVLSALMKAFDDFIKRKLMEQFKSTFGAGDSEDQKEDVEAAAKLQLPNSQALSNWLNTTCSESLLCQQALRPFFENPHILGSLGDSLKIVFDSL